MDRDKQKAKDIDEKISVTKMPDGWFCAERYSTRARHWVYIGRRRNLLDLEKLLDKDAFTRIQRRHYTELIQYVKVYFAAESHPTTRESCIAKEFPALRHFSFNRYKRKFEKG